ncbi:MAG: hypothetical protein WBD40_08055, partial [Tepidisphaeraceae bacterium]
MFVIGDQSDSSTRYSRNSSAKPRDEQRGFADVRECREVVRNAQKDLRQSRISAEFFDAFFWGFRAIRKSSCAIVM